MYRRHYIVFGDIHGHGEWQMIVEKHLDDPDVVFVFLGDYLGSHEDISAEEQILNLLRILEFKEEFPERIILLRGNHDMQHLGYTWAECSNLNRGVLRQAMKPEFSERFLSITQWVYLVDNICFSHAGISNTWFKETGCKSIEEINSLEPSPLFGFTPNRLDDFYGESTSQPCTWIRPASLLVDIYEPEKYIQVVGHTTRNSITNSQWLFDKNEYPELAKPQLWLCDCNLKEYLEISGDSFSPKQILTEDEYHKKYDE